MGFRLINFQRFLLNSTAQLKEESNKNGEFIGLLIDNELFNLVMPYPTKMQTCKIHRKSGFVLITLQKKIDLISFPSFGISFNKLSKISFDNLSLGIMFSDEFLEAKNDENKLKKLPKLKQLICGLKENVQIIFVKAREYKVLLLQHNGSYIGCLLFHGIYEFPPTKNGIVSTPFVDASLAYFDVYTFLIIRGDDLFNLAVAKCTHEENPVLLMESNELEPMKQLFNSYHRTSLDKTIHTDLKVFEKHKDKFQRLAVYPLYSIKQKRFNDEMEMSRNNMTDVNKKYADMKKQLNRGDLTGIGKLMKDKGLDPSKLDKLHLAEKMNQMGLKIDISVLEKELKNIEIQMKNSS